ncbi:MAG: integrase [Pirellulaceae bacterium]|nr:integrase [Pirellulaceae bacterium]
MSVSVPKRAVKFPLFKHPRGYWCKTVLGKHRYFGKIEDDPQGKEALKHWLHDRPYRLAGLEPPAFDENDAGVISVKYVCNAFLEAKEAKLDAGNLSKRTWDELKTTCDLLMKAVPPSLEAKLLQPVHFAKILAAINKRCQSPNTRGKFIGQVKAVFVHAYANGLIDRPANFGSDFKKPPQIAYRQHENAKGDQSFTAVEVNRLLKAATVNAKAMILLGLQGGLANTELAELPRSAIKGAWLDWPRAKTATRRRIPLWPETQKAIKAAIAHGPEDGELVFYRNKRQSFCDDQRNGQHVGRLFVVTSEKAKVVGHSFYDLRRTFQTVAENMEPIDPAAIRAIMGHVDGQRDMSSRYRQNIADKRLQAVTEHVRKWLGKPAKRGAK